MKFRIETARDFENNAGNYRKKLPTYIKSYMNRYKLTYEDVKNLGVFIIDIDINTSSQELSDLMTVLGNCPSIYIVVINIAKEALEIDRLSDWNLINFSHSCYSDITNQYRRHSRNKRLKDGFMEVWSRPPIRFNYEIL